MKVKSKQAVDVCAKTQAFFEAVISDDSTTKTLINMAAGNITFKKGQLVFDLSSLHRVVFPSNEIDYKKFKQIIYSSELNKNLMKKGVQVVVWQNTNSVIKSKVDVNLYCLQIDKPRIIYGLFAYSSTKESFSNPLIKMFNLASR